MPSNKEREEFGTDYSNFESKVDIQPWHPDKARMGLAYWVLAGIFFFFILAIACHMASHFGYIGAELSSALLEICRTGLLPIVTLVLGYYFSKGS